MEIVDPTLQRDGEIDQVLLPAAEQHELRGSNGAELPPREHRHDERDHGRRAGAGCDPLGGGEAHALPEREDDLVLRRGVRRGRLAGHGLDVDLDRRRQAEEAVDVDVGEGHGLRLPGVDNRDLLSQHDRPLRLLDRERHTDVELLEVAGVLHGHLEGEVGRGGDFVVACARSGNEGLAVGQRLHRSQRAAVLAAGIAARGRAVHALPHGHHRRRAGEVGIGEHGRVGHPADVADVLPLQFPLSRLLEIEVPVHVAGDEQARLIGDQGSGRRRVARGRRLPEGVREPAQGACPQLQHLDQMIVLDTQRARRVEVAGLGDLLLLLGGVALDLGLELALLDAGGGERGVELLPDSGRAAGNAPDVGDVAVVLPVLAARGAAPRENDEQHDGQDEEGDQPREAEHGDEPGRGPDRASRAARRRPARHADAFGRFLGFGLVEEVELDICIALGHRRGPSRSRRHSNERLGRGGIHNGPANPGKPMSNAAPALLQSELVLGRYRPLKPLGSGGSGSVWLARDEQSGLDVALKIVPREGKAASRAEREAEAAARLRHPSCQRAYGFGRDSQHVYIAYEYVPGRTFREALRSGELDDASAIEAAIQILDALAHAHARGVVHRDVKPSNVLLAEGREVHAKVLDFGLAQIQEAETLTAQGDVPGTLAYIAPERLAGAQTTEAADVWAVGVMLWEALAGRHPFWRSSLLDTARAIEVGPPPLETLRPDLPKSLLAPVGRALNLDPSRRPGAAVLAGALRLGGRKRRVRKGGGQTLAVPAGAPRLVPPVLAALVAGWTAWVLPFFPTGW